MERTSEPLIIISEENNDKAINIPEVRNKIIVKLGLSRKRHIPVIWVAGITNFNLCRLDVFLKYRGLTLTRIDDNHKMGN